MLLHPPLIVLLLVLLLCKVSVTVGSKRKSCFLTNEALRTAVKNYVSGGRTKKKATIAKYGSPIGNWCVGKVKDFSYVFAGEFTNQNYFNEPLTNWDTSKATTMKGMFNYATKFNQPLKSWNVSRVTDMGDMFDYASNFNQPLKSWDVSRVIYMYGMFSCAVLFNQPLNSWNVSQVTEISSMFYNTTSFNQPLNSWNVSQVRHMYAMFEFSTSFNQPLDTWDVSRVTDLRYMFAVAVSFNQPLNSWNVGKVTDMSAMFTEAWSFNQPLNSWNVAQVNSMKYMFQQALSFDQNLCSWGYLILSACDVDYMFDETNCPENDPPNFSVNPPGPLCEACGAIIISAGLEMTGLFAQQNVVLLFQLNEKVEAGHRVTCELEVPNGDANLFINLGSIPQNDRDCDCASMRFGPFDEDCTTGPANATATTSAYISVQAAQQSSNMTLLCKINAIDCLDTNQLCNTTEDCCGTNVCDGNATVAPRCVPCGKPEPWCDSINAKCPSRDKPCTKSSGQCCRRFACSDGVCKKKS